MSDRTNLVFCSKSPWLPAMRREHHLAIAAVVAGMRVRFLEAPLDIRTGRRALAHRSTQSDVMPRLTTQTRFVPVPGHVSSPAAHMNSRMLARMLKGSGAEATVFYRPWDWCEVNTGRRIFDCTDSWPDLYPSRRRWIMGRLADIATAADEITVVAPALSSLFGGRTVTVVPNGTDEALLETPITPLPSVRRAVYVGTLSERFDAPLVSALLDRLEERWHLEIWGTCNYAGRGTDPAEEFTALLGRHPTRVRWHGALDRRDVGAVLDAADVVVIPNRPELSAGQSSMKIFDAAARGRRIVAGIGTSCGAVDPPDMVWVEGVDEWAEAMEACIDPLATESPANRMWASRHTWQRRFDQWSPLVVPRIQ